MKVIPVIHINNIRQAVEQVKIVKAVGLDTVALIQMSAKDAWVDSAMAVCRDEFPEMKFIPNYLSVPHIHDAMTRAKLSDAAGFWIDNAGVYEGHMSEEFAATSTFLETRMFSVYTGFNFKYQLRDDDPAASMKVIQDAGFIPCTSGRGTGEAPDLEYLSALRAKVPEGRLAIASGVTPANAAKFHGLVTDILVATGISSSFYEIDPVKLEALLEAIRR